MDLDELEPVIQEEDLKRRRSLSISQLAELTGLPVGTIRAMCREDAIPHSRDGQGRYRFDGDEVCAALKKMMER